MNKFEYLQPKSVKSALKFIESDSDSLPYAGGTDILGMMKDEIISPSKLVNLKNIGGFSYINYDNVDGLRIGAATKLSDIAENEIVKTKYTALYDALKQLATPQLRNVGTIGGNICQRPRCFYFRGNYNCLRKGGNECYAFFGNNKYHCIIGGDPCYIVHPSDTAVVLVALNAKFKISSSKEDRIVPAREFFILPKIDETRENILTHGEIITEIIIDPPPRNNTSKYIKVKERGAWDFILVSIAGIFYTNGEIISEGTIAFGGVAPIPWLDKSVNDYLKNMKINEKNIQNLADIALSDPNALEMNSYKISLTKNLIKKIFYENFANQ